MRRWLALLVVLLVAPPAWADDVRIAVAEFDNAADTSEFDALGKGLQAMLTTDLSQVHGLVLVERDRLSDVVSELELGGSGLVDPETAAEVGRLLGATHVVAGTFTVVGDAMRLDARLVQVSSGEVVLAADAHGERDAFFELEKELVKGLLDALDAELSPKERAAIARIHTADFAAFEQFSEGVALYDQERYDEAVATLKQVLVADEEFRLAERTLESYEQLIADIRTKSRAIELTEAEARFVARQEAAQAEAALVGQLYDVADSPESSFEDRVAALYLLQVGLEPFGSLRELHRTEDEFALARAGEVAYARMYAEVRPRFPDLNPFYSGSFGWFREGSPFDEQFPYLRGKLLGGVTSLDMATCNSRTRVGGDGFERLHLDVHERVAELAALAEEGRHCIGERRYFELVEEVADLHAELLDVDRSTDLLEGLAASTDDTDLLGKIERMVVDNRELKEDLSGDTAPIFREWALLNQHGKGNLPMYRSYDFRQAREGTPHALWQLSRLRGLYEGVREHWIWVGDELVWVLPNRGQELGTGPRPVDPLRTTSLRYYGNAVPKVEFGRERVPDPPAAWWMLFGMAPRTDVSVSFELAHAPTDEWWPAQRPPKRDEDEPRVYSEGQPLVGVVFGLRDVNVDAICDTDGVGMRSVPMQGWGVVVEGDQVHLARVIEVDPDWSEDRCSLFTDFVDDWAWEPVASAKGKQAPGAVSVTVEGARVTVKLDRTTRRFDLPEPVQGFPGLVMDGVGYVEISALEVE